MTDDLKRRISDALLKGSLETDASLRDALAADPEAKAYAEELQKLDGMLRGWPEPDKSDESWEALASRIDQRMKDPLRAPGDMTLPPRFDDDDPFVREPRHAAAKPGTLGTRAPTTTSPLKGAFTPLKPGEARAVAPAKPAAPASPKPAAPVAAKPAAKPAAPAPVAKAEEPAEAAAVALAPPPPGATPEPPHAEAAPEAPHAEAAPEPAHVDVEVPTTVEPITVSEPPSPISIPPGDVVEARDSLPEPKAGPPVPAKTEISLANLSKLDVKHASPPPVPAAAHAKPPKAPVQALPHKKDDRAELPATVQPLFELPTFDSPVTAPKVPAKKSRAPLYGMLSLAAALALGFGGWIALNQSGANEAAAPVGTTGSAGPVAAPTDDQVPASQGAAPTPVAPPTATTPVPMGGVPAQPSPAVAAADRGQAEATPTTGGLNGLGNAQQRPDEIGGEGEGATAGGGGGGAPPPPAHLVAENDTAAQTDAHGAAPQEALRPHHAITPPDGASHDTVRGGGGGGHAGGPAGGDTGTATTHHAHSGGGGGGSADAPPRDQIVSAMGSVRSAVVACAAGRGGVAWVQVTFAGPTGRVSNAVVQGTFAGTPQGSCIARAVRGASVPPFRNATFSVAYPFPL